MSEFFQWDKAAYTVDVDAMDGEHERLIGIMNDLHEKHAAGAGRAQLEAIVKKLAEYTTRHFRNEEAYMESIGFPGLGTHKRIHATLLEKFGAHVAAFRASGELTEDFFLFLRRWLKAHIQGIDRKYGEHAGSPSAPGAASA